MRTSKLKRLTACLLAALSALTLLIPQVMAEDRPVTRMEWVQQLVDTFDIAVEESDYPDNYYSDITEDSTGYADLMAAVQYGVIDLGAGEPFQPDEVATRAFAAQTLNDMLGFYLEEDTVYGYDEAAGLEDPDDLQVALNRGWFTLTDGKILPEQAVTTGEMESIFADVAELREQSVVDPDYNSTYTFVDGVIVVPESLQVTMEDDTVRIWGLTRTIAEGDRFVVWGNGIPVGYVAQEVSYLSGVTTIQATRAEDEEIFESIDAEDVIYVAPTDVVPAEGTTVSYYAPELDRHFDSCAEAQAALRGEGVSPQVDLEIGGKYTLGDGVSVSVSGAMKNVTVTPKLHSNIALLRLEYDLEFKYSVKCDLAGAVDMGEVPLLFWGVEGIGGVDVSLKVEVALSAEGTQKTHVVNELSCERGGSPSLLGKSTPKDFVHTLEGSAKVGIVSKFGITRCPLINGYIYLEAGGTGKLKTMTYEDGDAPFECRHFAAYLYAEAGAKASVKLLGAIEKSCSYKRTLLDEDNSPVRIIHHYEDGKLVQGCTHGNVDEWFGKWSTLGTSRYMSSGWSSGFGGTGYGVGGVPVIIYDYSVDDDGNATITHYYGNARSLIIPAKLDGYPVVKIGDGAFKNNKLLTDVTIPDSVTEIGGSAFSNCTALTSVTLPKNLTTLGNYAFGSSGLTEITIPKTLTTAGSTYGWDGPFENCAALHTATLEDGMTAVAAHLFADCNGLQSVTIPDSVTEIEYAAFSNCTALTTVPIPDSVTVIGGSAFSDCTALPSITIPESVTQIDECAFASCTSLTAIVLPNSVTGMGTGVFQNCTALTDVTLPNIRQNIAASTFRGCTALEKIALPDTVTSIRESAFQGCSALTEIVWSEDLSLIEATAFRDCAALTEVHIPEGVTTMGKGVFYNCDALTEVSIPDSVTSFGSSMFYDCDALTAVKLGSGLTSLPGSTFQHCDVLAELRLPRRVTSIGDAAFKDCVKFTSIFIPRSVTSISSTAFSYLDKLTIGGVPGTYAETFATEHGITFVDQSVPATAAALSETELALYKGGSTQLRVTVTPEDFTDEVVWKCSDTSVATVSDDGVVKAISGGSATIKVSVGNISLSCRVTVLQPVTSVYINGYSSRTLAALETCQLTVTVNPSDAHDPRVEWSSSDPTVATVDETGLVTALRKGSATITATAQDGSGKYDTCQITVSNNAWVCDDPAQLESPHNYENSCTDVWLYTVEGATELWVTFDAQTYLEDGFDYLYVYDEEGRSSYTGDALAGATLHLTGDTVKLQLSTDSSGTEWGFKVTEVRTNVVETDPEPEPVIPDAPVVSTGNVSSSGAIKLTWDAVDGAAQYEVYRSGSKNGTYTLKKTLTATSWTNTAVTAGYTYYYKVVALTTDGTRSEDSAIVSCTADCAMPVVKTGNVSSSGNIQLTWDKVTGAGQYEVYRSGSKNGTYTLKATVSDATWTDTAATAGYTYYYKVKALCSRNSNGDSAFSAAVSRTADCAAPKISSSNVSTGGIKLTWSAVTGASKYEIYRATSKDGNYSKYTTVTGTSWTNTAVTPGRTYYYMIKAVCGRNSNGNSAFSNVASRTADCIAPKLSSSIVSSSGAIKLTWDAVDGASKYEIYRATSKDGTYSKYTTVTGTSWTNKSVTPGKTYYYKVKAICGRSSYGNSAYSNIVSRTADCAKPVVTIQLNGGKPQLKWSAIDGASKYYIYRSTDGGKTYSCFTTVTATSWTNKSAKAGTTYYYKVVAVCAKSSYGNSAYSNIVSIKSK